MAKEMKGTNDMAQQAATTDMELDEPADPRARRT